MTTPNVGNPGKPPRITVRYWAQAAIAAGTQSQVVTIDSGNGVDDVLRRLGTEHPALGTMMFDAVSHGNRGVLVFVNDQQVETGLSPALSDGDELLILAPMAGG